MQNRRDMLRNSALGFGSLALTSILQAQNPLATKRPHFATRAKRIIFLFMKGGPSQVDTFEYKPLLQRDHGKPLPFDKPKVTFAKTGNLLASPWKFKPYGQCGHKVSELFPNVARHVDDICFLHGVHGTNPAHGGALLKLHTGADNFVRPSMGAWVGYGLGTENENLPSFVTICPTLAHGGLNNWGSAFLPAHYGGTPIGNASLKAKDAKVHHIKNPKWTVGQQRAQLDFLKQINQDHLAGMPSPVLESRINSFELAYRMQTAMPEIQDIRGETDATRKLYGLDEAVTEDFGRQCLMARRFAERGVRFVQVSHSDSKVQWDQHGNLKKGHAEKASEVDKPIAGLLHDLKSRGLLDDTLVLWSGEFGRTPTVQGAGMNGRDHNPWGFTMWMAGGGVKGGFAHGATDDYGFYAEQQKMHIHDVHATVLHLLGLDHEKLTYRYAGRDFRLTDVSGHVAREIFA
ncbi:MAG: DUF1501 domain-containing protein [Verrucomicrobiota bacterium]|nr:DUF1501 domain-containing protein [Verrucomicrobiota bacterium]